MKKLTKTKLLALTLVLVMVCSFVLVACNKDAKETLENYELNVSGVVSADFTLPNAIGDEDVGGPFPVTWSSDNEAVIAIEERENDFLAKVTLGDEVTRVNLTVKLVKGGKSRTFEVRVAGIDASSFADNYDFKKNNGTVYESFKLDRKTTYKGKEATIDWSVDDEYKDVLTISEDGNTAVVPEGIEGSHKVRIRATFTYGTDKASRNYSIIVSAKGDRYILKPIEAPAAGTYKLGMFQSKKETWYFATGVMGGYNDYYYATTTDGLQAADYEIKKSGDDWTIQVKDSGKYLNMVARDGATAESPSASLYLVDTEVVWKWSTDLKAFYREILGKNFFLGNYNDYTDIGSAEQDKYTSETPNYLAQFGTLEKDTSVPEEIGYGSADAPLTVAQALKLANQKLPNKDDVTEEIVYAKGKVKTQPDNSGTNIKQFTLQDLDTPSKDILVYTMNKSTTEADPDQNDVIVICGYIKNFNGTIEFAANGSTYVELLNNTRGESTVTLGAHTGATVSGLPTEAVKNGNTVTFTVNPEEGKEIASVSVYGSPIVSTGDNSYTFTVHGNATVSVATKQAGLQVLSENVVFATYGVEQGWTSGSGLHPEIKLGTAVTLTVAVGAGKTASNTGKWYSTAPGTWRLYKSEDATLTISVTDSYKLYAVKITFSSGNFIDTDGVTSGELKTIDGDLKSITFTVGVNIFISAIEVQYVAA